MVTKAGISTFLSVCFLCFVSWSAGAAAQEVPTLLQVDLENWVNYAYDVTDLSKLAKSPGPVAWAGAPANFSMWVSLVDITAVNGSPAKGTMVAHLQLVSLTPNPNPGQAVGDVVRSGYQRMCFEFLKDDGGLIGSIFALGLSGGTPPPGSPAGVVRGNFAIVGGTGAFVGARGTVSALLPQSSRNASQAEDPSMRRINGGGKGAFLFQIWPMYRPEVLVTTTGPAVFHADYSPVTAEKPAQRGETLIVYARNLGPTNPGVNPGEPFPSDPVAIVTSPIEVFVDGKPAPAINQLGIPGLVDTYRVDFRVPADVTAGMSPIQLSAAWVKGPPVRISVK